MPTPKRMDHDASERDNRIRSAAFGMGAVIVFLATYLFFPDAQLVYRVIMAGIFGGIASAPIVALVHNATNDDETEGP